MTRLETETEAFWDIAAGARWALRWGDARDRVIALHALGEFAVATHRQTLKGRALAMLGDVAAHHGSRAVRAAAAQTISGVAQG